MTKIEAESILKKHIDTQNKAGQAWPIILKELVSEAGAQFVFKCAYKGHPGECEMAVMKATGQVLVVPS